MKKQAVELYGYTFTEKVTCYIRKKKNKHKPPANYNLHAILQLWDHTYIQTVQEKRTPESFTHLPTITRAASSLYFTTSNVA